MILITGANGSNGREILKLFKERDIPVRAMVRDKSRATEIDGPNVEIVEGDFDKPATIEAALKGIERAFLLTPSSQHAESQQLGFVEAARQSGVKHIVKLSQLGADTDSPARFLRYHAAVERAIEKSGLDYTFLRPNLFMQGLLSFKPTIVEQNAFYAAAGEGKTSVVDTRDIASVAVATLTQAGHEGAIYDLTGPQALTHAEMAAQLSQAVGREIAFVDVSPQDMRASLLQIGFPVWQADGLLEEYAQWSQSEAAGVESGVRDATGQEPRDFAGFAGDYAAQFAAA